MILLKYAKVIRSQAFQIKINRFMVIFQVIYWQKSLHNQIGEDI